MDEREDILHSNCTILEEAFRVNTCNNFDQNAL